MKCCNFLFAFVFPSYLVLMRTSNFIDKEEANGNSSLVPFCLLLHLGWNLEMDARDNH